MRLRILVVFVFSKERKEIMAMKEIANERTVGGGKGG